VAIISGVLLQVWNYHHVQQLTATDFESMGPTLHQIMSVRRSLEEGQLHEQFTNVGVVVSIAILDNAVASSLLE